MTVVEEIIPAHQRIMTMREIKIERNRLLAACDWTQLPDVPITIKTAWAEYRQQLRDLPANCDINNPVWPTEPKEQP